MTVQDFFNTYNGYSVDYDGYYDGQCMDLYQLYNDEVIEAPHIPADAHQVWVKFPQDHYIAIGNTPSGVPQKGDVVIWGKSKSLPFGHIAIFMEGNVNTFNSFDQNWPEGSVCHLQGHDYTGVLGWLRPKILPVFELTGEGGEEVITLSTKIPQIYDKEVQHIKSEYDRVPVLEKDLDNARNEIVVLKDDKRILTDLVNDLQAHQGTGEENALVLKVKEGIAALRKLFGI